MKLRGEVAFRDNEIVKQKVMFERDLQELRDETNALKKELKQTIKKNENVELPNLGNRTY